MSLLKILTAARTAFITKRFYSDKCPKKFSVAVIGAAGGIGQPLSLLLKLNPHISELRLHDIANTPGVAADLSHIETAVKVKHSTGKDPSEALAGGVDIIVVPAGMPRKPGMKRADLFKSNAQVGYDVAQSMAKNSPESILIIITNPVNSLIPVICEVLQNKCCFNPSKIIGASTLDSVRAATFVAEISGGDPKDYNIPVILGHSAETIIPLISRSNPPVKIEGEKLDKLVKHIQEAGTEVVNAKAGKGSATLSMAYAGSRLTFSILRAMSGEPNIVECCFVRSDVYPQLKYIAAPVLFGKNGIEKHLGIGKMSEYETKNFCKAIEQLKNDIKTGEDFAKEQLAKEKKS